MLGVITLSVIMLNVVMLNVVAPTVRVILSNYEQLIKLEGLFLSASSNKRRH